MLGEIDLAHAAATQEARDRVARELLTHPQWHGGIVHLCSGRQLTEARLDPLP
jgi:hypothetical protein